MIEFATPGYLHLLWLVPLGLVWVPGDKAVAPTIHWFCGCAARAVALGLVALALAQPFVWIESITRVEPVLVVVEDVSASMGGDRPFSSSQYASLNAAVDRIRHIQFAGDSWFGSAPPDADIGDSDIAAALNSVRRVCPVDSAPVVILVSDGQATRGDTLAAAQRLRAANATIHVVPGGVRREFPSALLEITPPEHIRVGETAYARIRTLSGPDNQIILSVLTENNLRVSERVVASAGEQVVGVPVMSDRRGSRTWRVVARDRVTDRVLGMLPLTFDVVGGAAVLLCDPRPTSLQPLGRALDAGGFQVTYGTPSDSPWTAEQLSIYDVVVISDWPQPLPDGDQLAGLRQYVEDGGSLLFIGGAAVSTEAWRGSTCERLLPIDFVPQPIEDRQPTQPAHVCFVIDSSGSMGEPLGFKDGQPVTKFQMVREALYASLQELPDSAAVSLVLFDQTFYELLTAVPVRDVARISAAINQMRVGGGTDLVPALRRGTELLAQTPIDTRHMVVLTDGISSTDPGPEEYRRLNALDVSMTVIAVGQDTNRAALATLAQRTGGVLRECDNASRIPRLLIEQAHGLCSASGRVTNPRPARLIAGHVREPIRFGFRRSGSTWRMA